MGEFEDDGVLSEPLFVPPRGSKTNAYGLTRDEVQRRRAKRKSEQRGLNNRQFLSEQELQDEAAMIAAQIKEWEEKNNAAA